MVARWFIVYCPRNMHLFSVPREVAQSAMDFAHMQAFLSYSIFRIKVIAQFKESRTKTSNDSTREHGNICCMWVRLLDGWSSFSARWPKETAESNGGRVRSILFSSVWFGGNVKIKVKIAMEFVRVDGQVHAPNYYSLTEGAACIFIRFCTRFIKVCVCSPSIANWITHWVRFRIVPCHVVK